MEQPLHIWVPSIGISGAMFYTGDRFPQLEGQPLHRRHGRRAGRTRDHRRRQGAGARDAAARRRPHPRHAPGPRRLHLPGDRGRGRQADAGRAPRAGRSRRPRGRRVVSPRRPWRRDRHLPPRTRGRRPSWSLAGPLAGAARARPRRARRRRSAASSRSRPTIRRPSARRAGCPTAPAYSTVEPSGQRRHRHRPLRRGDRRAPRARRRRRAWCRPGAQDRARHRRLRVVGRRRRAARLHQHREGVAAEHARRLLGARPRLGPADAARRRGAGLVADVRQVLARRHPRRLRARQRPLRRAARATAASRG